MVGPQSCSNTTSTGMCVPGWTQLACFECDKPQGLLFHPSVNFLFLLFSLLFLFFLFSSFLVLFFFSCSFSLFSSQFHKVVIIDLTVILIQLGQVVVVLTISVQELTTKKFFMFVKHPFGLKVKKQTNTKKRRKKNEKRE